MISIMFCYTGFLVYVPPLCFYYVLLYGVLVYVPPIVLFLFYLVEIECGMSLGFCFVFHIIICVENGIFLAFRHGHPKRLDRPCT